MTLFLDSYGLVVWPVAALLTGWLTYLSIRVREWSLVVFFGSLFFLAILYTYTSCKARQTVAGLEFLPPRPIT